MKQVKDVARAVGRVPVRVDREAVVCVGAGALGAAALCTAGSACLAPGALIGLAVYGANRAVRLGHREEATA